MKMFCRRPVLSGLLALGGAGLLVYGGSHVACAAPVGQRALLAPLFGALAALPDPVAVGRAWDREEPVRAAAEALLRDGQLARVALLPGAEARRDALAHRIRAEFDRGDVVLAAGWLVSRTEARLAAVAL